MMCSDRVSGWGELGDSLVIEDFFGCFIFCSDVDHIWKEVGFVKLESGDLLVTGHLSLLDLLLHFSDPMMAACPGEPLLP